MSDLPEKSLVQFLEDPTANAAMGHRCGYLRPTGRTKSWNNMTQLEREESTYDLHAPCCMKNEKRGTRQTSNLGDILAEKKMQEARSVRVSGMTPKQIIMEIVK